MNNYYQDYSGGFNNNVPPPPPPPPAVPPPPPPPQNFNSQGQYPANNQNASTNAILALVFGIVSYVICPFFSGIAAWIMGHIELSKIKRGESSQAGKGFATAGMWLGIVNVALTILGILAYIVIVVFILAVGSTHRY